MKKHKKKNKNTNLPKKKRLTGRKTMAIKELEGLLSLFSQSQIGSILNKVAENMIKSHPMNYDTFRFKLNADSMHRNMARYVKIILIDDVVTVQFIGGSSNGLLHDPYEFLNSSLREESSPIEDLIEDIFDSINMLKSECLNMDFIKEASDETGFSQESILIAFEKFFDTLFSESTTEINRFLKDIEYDTVYNFIDIQQSNAQTTEVMESL